MISAEFVNLPLFYNARISCNKCGSDLSGACSLRFLHSPAVTSLGGYYSCDACDSWTADVRIEEKQNPFSIISIDCC